MWSAAGPPPQTDSGAGSSMVRVVGADGIEAATAILADGGLVAFPTETVYGLGADAGSAAAVTGIFEAKGRPKDHPLIVHIADAGEIHRYANRVPSEAELLADAFWPGPLTIVVDRGDRIAPETVGGLDTVGIRVPDHPMALELLTRFGGPVAAPSANRFGSVSPTTAQHVVDDLGSAVDLVLDGGPCAVGVESTIIDLTGSAPKLLRPGGISAVELEAVLGVAVVDDRAGPSRAPGMLRSHYAPRTAVELVPAVEPGADGAGAAAADRSLAAATAAGASRVGLIAPFANAHCPSWRLPADASGYAAKLYAALREADGHDLDMLLIAPPTAGRLLDAVLDRLSKAAAPRR